MHWSRRGDLENRVWLSMIYSVIVLIVILFVYTRIIGVNRDVSSDAACEESVMLAGTRLRAPPPNPTDVEGIGKYMLSQFIDPFGKGFELQCSTHYYDVTEKKPEEIEKMVADSMVQCWKTYGEGKKELFDTKDNTYCIVCSRLSFKEKTTLPQFTTYLKENLKPLSKDETYFDYLAGVHAISTGSSVDATEFENKELLQMDSLSTENPIAVMYIMSKAAYPDSVLKQSKTASVMEGTAFMSLAGTATGIALCGTGVGCIATVGVVLATGGGTVGYFIGSDKSAEWDARVTLVEYDHLKDLKCTYLEAKSTPLQVKDVNDLYAEESNKK